MYAYILSRYVMRLLRPATYERFPGDKKINKFIALTHKSRAELVTKRRLGFRKLPTPTYCFVALLINN